MSKLANRVLGAGFLVMAVAGCAGGPAEVAEVASRQASIVGGQSVTAGQYPNVVALLLGGSLCTGTLVAPNVVVTAAHCVEAAELRVGSQAEVTAQTRAVFDATALNGGVGFAVQAASTLPQPAFDINALGRHDIGVVVLSQRVTDRAPAPIIRDAGAVAPGSQVTLVGYGISRVVNGVADGNSAGSENQLVNKGTIDCAQLGEQNADLICFDQSDGKGSCNGDSGGPAFTQVGGKLTLAGITSFGDQQCVQVGAYTRLTAEIAFLEQQMNAADACATDGVCTPACGAGSLPIDRDCGSAPGSGSPPDPGTGNGTPPLGNPGGNPGNGDPAVGDPPGLTGGCSIGAAGDAHGGDDDGLVAVALALVSLIVRVSSRRRAARAQPSSRSRG